jgi:hypothetical protein
LKQAKAEKAAALKQAKAARRAKKREAKVLKEAASAVDAAIGASKQTSAGGKARKSKRRKCVQKKAQQEECEFPFMALCEGQCKKWVGVMESKVELDYWACQTCMEQADLLMMQ